MDENKKNLKGSEKRDLFKWAHKNKMEHCPFYAADADLCLVSFDPRGVVAYLDYKGSGEGITDSEKVLYDEWSITKPVYIIEGKDPENGPFEILKYIAGGDIEKLQTVSGWMELYAWEASVRREYHKNNKPLPVRGLRESIPATDIVPT